MNLPAEQKYDLLLAEDDDDDAAILETAITELNISYELRRAMNGDKLFILLKERQPYLLFLDIHMPCKDGISCIMEIRKNPEYDNLPVIMYTSVTSRRDIEACFRNGANLYLQKPHSFEQLKINLEKIFSIDWSRQLHYPPLDQFILS